VDAARSTRRLEDRLSEARQQLTAAEQARDAAEAGSADFRKRVALAERRWLRVRQLERELEAVRLAQSRR
jgi:hypothetical protein